MVLGEVDSGLERLAVRKLSAYLIDSDPEFESWTSGEGFVPAGENPRIISDEITRNLASVEINQYNVFTISYNGIRASAYDLRKGAASLFANKGSMQEYERELEEKEESTGRDRKILRLGKTRKGLGWVVEKAA